MWLGRIKSEICLFKEKEGGNTHHQGDHNNPQLLAHILVFFPFPGCYDPFHQHTTMDYDKGADTDERRVTEQEASEL